MIRHIKSNTEDLIPTSPPVDANDTNDNTMREGESKEQRKKNQNLSTKCIDKFVVANKAHGLAFLALQCTPGQDKTGKSRAQDNSIRSRYTDTYMFNSTVGERLHKRRRSMNAADFWHALNSISFSFLPYLYFYFSIN